MTTPDQSLRARAERGEYELIEPLDYLLLSHLPEEGTLAFGLYPMGETIKNLRSKFSKEQQAVLPITMLSTRMRLLHHQGLVSSSPMNARTHVWQRTKTGKQIYEQWEATRNGSSTNKK